MHILKYPGFFLIFTNQDISYVVIIVPGRVLLWLCKPSWRYTQEMLQMQPWNRNIQLLKKVSLFPIQHMLGHLYCESKIIVYRVLSYFNMRNKWDSLHFNKRNWFLLPNIDMTPHSPQTTKEIWIEPVLSRSPVGETKIPDPEICSNRSVQISDLKTTILCLI